MYELTKEVYFDRYCLTCKYKDVPEEDDPCRECLTYPSNVESHKPVNWKSADRTWCLMKKKQI